MKYADFLVCFAKNARAVFNGIEKKDLESCMCLVKSVFNFITSTFPLSIVSYEAKNGREFQSHV